MVAGGMESMSNAVYYMKRGDTPYGGIKLIDSITHDGLTDAYDHIHMGLCAEKTAKENNCTRADQDTYATESYKKVVAAYKAGAFNDELLSVNVPANKRGAPDVVIKEDEEYKRVNFDKMGQVNILFSLIL